MEAITIINSASVAKHADCVPRDEALLTRLHNNHVAAWRSEAVTCPMIAPLGLRPRG